MLYIQTSYTIWTTNSDNLERVKQVPGVYFFGERFVCHSSVFGNYGTASSEAAGLGRVSIIEINYTQG